MTRRAVALVALLLTGAVTGVTALGDARAGATDAEALRIRALSSRAAYVTGGDVLVGVTGTRSAPEDLELSLDGDDVTRAAPFEERAGRIVALVRGMEPGTHRITVRDGARRATLRVVDHPSSGPVLSGPHGPLLCTAERVPTGPSTDVDCAVPTEVSWQYWRVAGGFAPLGDPSALPPDVARIDDQATVPAGTPFVVRVERGVINRSPYETAVLDGVPSTPVPDGWNARLVYQYGGGCGTSYSQGQALGTNALDAQLLRRGYGVATANFNTFQTSCNDVLSAETTMMVKERFIETLGVPEHTIGFGLSGGAIQQLLIAQNYPGLLDALVPVLPFPDAMSIAPGVADCGLLEHYYRSPAGQGLTDAQRAAINGHAVARTCGSWVATFLSGIDPYKGCDPRIPADRIFSPSNQDGIRCTLQDYGRNLFGIDPETGFARRPLDNTGVQYGLDALEAGVISVDQFLELNNRIGGYDINGVVVPERMAARATDVRRTYATGRIFTGGGGVRDLPIVTVNLYADDKGDIHDRHRLFAIRERLRDDRGRVNRNQIIVTVPSDGDLVRNLTGRGFDGTETIVLVDEWLTSGSRPATAVDQCIDAQGQTVRGSNVYRAGPCRDVYPVHQDPRTAAGAPLANDIVKCRLERVEPSAYSVAFTDAQVARLRAVFPDGVCDWDAPGVGEVPLAATWIDYGRPPFRAPGIGSSTPSGS